MERKQIELRIIKILSLIHHPITQTLEESFSLFSPRELLQILKFLETGDLNPIHQFLTEKTQEYKTLLEHIKMKKAFSKLQKHKLSEAQERNLEQEEAEQMINFE